MIKTITRFIAIVFGIISMQAQDFSSLWTAHYSYFEIVDVVSNDNKIYAAAENVVFEYDVTTTDIKTITTVEGLSGQNISTIYYSDINQILIIGYETGLIEIYSETDGSVLSVVDILEKQNITPDNKRINDFYEFDGLVYISTDFGVSTYDLDRLEFGDSFFLGNGGTQISVRQVSVLNNQIYAACLNNNGIKRADVDNPNLVDFSQWETVITGNFFTMNTLNDKIYSVRSDNQLFELDGTTNNIVFAIPFLPIDSKLVQNNLVFSSANSVRVYDSNLQFTASFQPTTDFSTNFSSATLVNDFVYIGTNSFGVLEANNSSPENFFEIRPNGPLRNSVFRLNANSGKVWATYGEYNRALNPFPLNSRGLSIFSENEWRNIAFDSLLSTRELNEIAPNPFNPDQVFISSMIDGVLVMENEEAVLLYDDTNSPLDDDVGIRITGSEFDENGILWVANSRVVNALKSFDPSSGNWVSHSFGSIISIPDNRGNFYDIEIDRNGTKWVGGRSNGLLAYNENKSEPLRNLNTPEQGVDPFTNFTALGIDDRNQLWVGTSFGLKVLNNTQGFFEDPNPTLDIIVIVEDELPQELLEGQSITDIKVDGSNNKWVGTVDSGAFYFSPDGQTTIHHFTTDNSPLPSNIINDISIDPNNGTVYIATSRGLLSFSAGGTSPTETLESAHVYPNPVRPQYNILGFNNLNDITKGVKIVGLTERVNIKITDIEGNLVAEAQSNINLRTSAANYNFAIDGGTAIWNGRNLANNIVRSGVYLILISDLESFETKVLKLLIVR